MRKVIVMRDVRRISGIILALSAMGLFLMPSALADSLSGGPFLGASSSTAGGPQNSSSFTSSGTQARTMGHSHLHSGSSGVGASHSYTGANYTPPGTHAGGYFTNYNWNTRSHNAYNGPSQQGSNARGPANPTVSSGGKPVVRNYIGRNTSHSGEINYYTWGINKLKNKRTIHR